MTTRGEEVQHDTTDQVLRNSLTDQLRCYKYYFVVQCNLCETSGNFSCATSPYKTSNAGEHQILITTDNIFLILVRMCFLLAITLTRFNYVPCVVTDLV